MEIISAKYVVTMEGEEIFDGAIAVEGDEIIDVGTEKDLLARYEDALHEDYPNHVILPGLINAHAHLDMTLHRDYPFDPVRSIGVDMSFVDWLLNCIEYKKTATPDKLRQAVEKGIEDSLEAGTTCVGDMGSFEGIFHSLDQAGLRAVIFPEVLSYDSSVAKDLYQTALAIVEKYMEYDSELISVGIGPYSPYTLSRNILRIMSQYCHSSKLPIMMHASESFSEMEFFYNSSGDIATRLFPNIGWGDNLPPAYHKTPIQHLEEIDFLSVSPILVGCSQMTPEDISRLAKYRAKVIWCPRSNEYLKLGRAPIKKMRDQKVCVALGTDGISSVNTLSLWDELRKAFELNAQEGWGLSAKELLAMVTTEASHALGLSQDIGSFSKGKKADYLVVEMGELSKGEDIYAHLIQNTKTYHLHKIVINGRTIKSIN